MIPVTSELAKAIGRRSAADSPRRRLSVLAEEETRLRAEVGVAPAIQNQAGDVAAGVEARRLQTSWRIVADPALVLAEWSGHQLDAALGDCRPMGKRRGEQDFQGEDDRANRAIRWAPPRRKWLHLRSAK